MMLHFEIRASFQTCGRPGALLSACVSRVLARGVLDSVQTIAERRHDVERVSPDLLVVDDVHYSIVELPTR